MSDKKYSTVIIETRNSSAENIKTIKHTKLFELAEELGYIVIDKDIQKYIEYGVKKV